MKLDSNFIAFCKQSIALEQRMAKQAGKRLNEAMRNNIQDINVLDRIADQLLDTMSRAIRCGRTNLYRNIYKITLGVNRLTLQADKRKQKMPMKISVG